MEVTVPLTEEKLLTPAEVALLFRVDPKTVSRWAKAGKLSSIRTVGGHRRYKESDIQAMLKASEELATTALKHRKRPEK